MRMDRQSLRSAQPNWGRCSSPRFFRSLSANTTVSFLRRKVVVQLQGINTTLTCKASGDCEGSTADFAKIRDSLRSQGFKDKDFLWYSYSGGTVDADTGIWLANTIDARIPRRAIQNLFKPCLTWSRPMPKRTLTLKSILSGIVRAD